MADQVTLNAASVAGGPVFVAEQLGGTGNNFIAVAKIHGGILDQDLGPNSLTVPIYISPATGAKFDVTPASPVATTYLPVRLTDGSAFYSATGGGGGGGAVTNAGTFAVQNTAATPAGTNVIGHVIVDTAPTTAVTGTFFQVTQPVSIAASVAITAAALPLPALAATSTKQPALGTAGTASTDVITVQGIAGGVAFVTGGNVASGATDSGNPVKVGGVYHASPITLTDGQRGDAQLDASGNIKVNIAAGASSGAVAQGSTTSGQTGSLIQGAVTTAAPTYTTGQTSPISLTTAGGQRTDLSSVGGTAVAAGASLAAASVPTAIATDQLNVVASGTFTASAQTLAIATNGAGYVTFTCLAGAYVGTTIVEATTDGTNWTTIKLYGYDGSAIATSSNVWQGGVACAGYQQVRLRCTAYTSGTQTIQASRNLFGTGSTNVNANLIVNGVQVTIVTPNADAVANSALVGTSTMAVGFDLNGAGTFDRRRNNQDVTLLASAARTTTTNSPDQTNYNGRGVKVLINVTVVGTSNLTLTLKGKESIAGTYYTLLASAVISGTGLTVLTVYPGLPATANVSANDLVPRTWRAEITHGDGSSWTYSVSGVTML